MACDSVACDVTKIEINKQVNKRVILRPATHPADIYLFTYILKLISILILY